MKKIFIALIVCSFVIVDGYCQTKEETENWIAEKINIHSFNDYEVSHDYKLSFKDGIMTVKNTVLGLETVYRIPVAKLYPITFERKQSSVWLNLKIKNGEKAIVLEGHPMGYYATENVNQMPFILLNSISEDNMQNRLKKAFSNLIKFYGGSINEAY